MKIYLVGGAVRDTLLKRPVTERDWVVVGATPSQLLEQGFQQVGKDFPVFLHPTTGDEYALARTERKSGQGYTGFDCYTSPDVTLEDDLRRRDLTVNAMAMDDDGVIFDPFNGQHDIENGVLRHVSEAFSEDPLRVFRVARFAARYHHLGFQVATDTLKLMTDMCKSTEIETLSQERIWKETHRSLMENTPSIYFAILQQVGALNRWMPELLNQHDLSTVLSQVDKAAMHNVDLPTRWALLCAALSEYQVAALGARLKTPNTELDSAKNASRLISILPMAQQHAEALLTVLNDVDAWRRPERLHRLLEVSQYWPAEQSVAIVPQRFTDALELAQRIDVQCIIASGAKGSEIKTALTAQRLQVITDYLLESDSKPNN